MQHRPSSLRRTSRARPARSVRAPDRAGGAPPAKTPARPPPLVDRGRDVLLGEQRHGARPRLALLENLDRLAPALALAVIDFAQIEHVALDDFAARVVRGSPRGHALVFD